MRPDVDVIIIGAGLAGLALAGRLAQSGQRHMRVELLEQAKAPALAQRSWSWFEAGPARIAFETSWPRWQVGYGFLIAGQAFTHGRYGLVRGSTLTEPAWSAIAASPSVVLRHGVIVSAIHAVPGGAQVETRDGPLSARLVIDTRPGGAELLGQARRVRTGIRAEVRTGSACFAPDTAVLVHRLRREGPAMVFETILPLAPDHAVIEAVRIAPSGDEGRPDFDGALERIVQGLATDISARTRSANPFGLSDQWPHHPSPVRMASSRGAGLALVAATGRDAQRSLAWARQASDALERGENLPGLPAQPFPARLGGKLLFRRLLERPSRLVAMAERARDDSVVRLAGGNATLADALKLMWAAR